MINEGMKKLIVIFLLAGILLLPGCGQNPVASETVKGTDKGKSAEELQMQDSVSLEYTVEPMKPKILVDLSGYEADNVKEAVMVSENLPKAFKLMNADNDECVFEGTTARNSEFENMGIADFTDFNGEGNFYISTDILGRSKVFSIHESDRLSMLRDTLKSLDETKAPKGEKFYRLDGSETGDVVAVDGGFITGENGERDVVENCLALLDMLTAYEYYGKVFTDDFGIAESGNGVNDLQDEIYYAADWLLSMQDAQTGGVYTGLHMNAETGELTMGVETTRSTAYFVTALSRASYILKLIDEKYSSTLFTASVKAFKCLEANKDIVAAEQMYRASVEMYRATGQYAYSSLINDYLKDHSDEEYESRITLDAAMSYMSTSRSLNVGYCTTLMQQFMARVEDQAALSKKPQYFAQPELNARELVRYADEMVMADYIITNQEYAKIEENYIHYLRGRNIESVNLIDGFSTPDDFAQLLIVVSKLYSDKQ